MVALDQVRLLLRATFRTPPGNVVLLASLVTAAVVTTLSLGGLLSLIFGRLPAWLWWTLSATQLASAAFLFALLSPGVDRRGVPRSRKRHR